MRGVARTAAAAALLLVVALSAQARSLWRLDIDGRDFIAPTETGFTDVVPPSGLTQRARANATDAGCLVELYGTELSAWQLAPIPRETRTLLNWHFDWEGEFVRGVGRMGFIFGSAQGANLLSVEVTRAGTLRLVRWGKQFSDSLGDIVWASERPLASSSVVKIEADYSIRDDILVCRVNDGAPVTIALRDYMPAPPMTMSDAGFFTAVPEARRDLVTSCGSRAYDIEMSARETVVLHRGLSAVPSR